MMLLFFPNVFPGVDGRTQSFQKLAEQIKSEFCSSHLLDFPDPSQHLNECCPLSHNSSATEHAGSSEGSNFLRWLDCQRNSNKKTNFKLNVSYKSHLRKTRGVFPLNAIETKWN